MLTSSFNWADYNPFVQDKRLTKEVLIEFDKLCNEYFKPQCPSKRKALINEFKSKWPGQFRIVFSIDFAIKRSENYSLDLYGASDQRLLKKSQYVAMLDDLPEQADLFNYPRVDDTAPSMGLFEVGLYFAALAAIIVGIMLHENLEGTPKHAVKTLLFCATAAVGYSYIQRHLEEGHTPRNAFTHSRVPSNK